MGGQPCAAGAPCRSPRGSWPSGRCLRRLSHGRSDPGEHGAGSSDAVELARGLDAVFARFGPACAVLAHSMGALSTLLALRDGWIGTEQLVLVSPFSGVPDLTTRFRRELGFGPRTLGRLEARAGQRTGYAVAELDVARMSTQIERPGLLVVHDERDRETSYARSLDLVAGWPGARLHTTRGLGHRRILADRSVIGVVGDFIDRVALDEGASRERLLGLSAS